jgi:UDP-2,3-diacylglucosamine hydrolase
MSMKLGLIAGNGSFPLLLLDAAKAQGYEVVVAAIKEETSAAIARKNPASIYWLSLGELSRLIEIFKAEGVTRAVMAGQVKHKQIFSAIKPDWRLAKLLLSLGTRNTDSLLGAIAKVLADEGIILENSTALLEPLLAKPGVLGKRAPNEQERRNIEYGREVARRLAAFDIGQTVVIAEAACVALEAMEGTDATIERAGQIMHSLDRESNQDDCPSGQAVSSRTLLSRALTVVKIAKPKQDMRFDVPVIGVKTIETMARAGASCLAIDAGRCLLLDGDKTILAADEAQVALSAD